MNIDKVKQICSKILLLYVLLAVAFYFVAGEEIRSSTNDSTMLSLKTACPSLVKGETLSQRYYAEGDIINSFTIQVGTYARQNTDVIHFTLTDETGSTVYEDKNLDTAEMSDLGLYTIVLDNPIKQARNKVFYLNFTSTNGNAENGIGFAYGDSMDTFRGSVLQNIPKEDEATVNGISLGGKLCLSANCTNYYIFGHYYWYFAAGFLLLLAAYLGHMIHCLQKHTSCIGLRLLSVGRDYGFLIQQMVSRDFKTKYKRSLLGALWSFLNPLLTMGVQYFVFATIFKSNIENYPIYLLTGIICFNFFSEAVGMCLSSIVGNAGLITKVYIPKYIFPFSRTLSSAINLLLSLIPLTLFLLITRTQIALSWLLVPFALVCLFAFSLGVGLVLATSMVFFRDTQFLWGVLSMLWMYLTPIFYSADIIPQQFMPIYKLNPLFHIIRFMRTALISGVSPEPQAYLFCILCSFIPLAIGALIFKKHQDEFVLNV